jgi:hypothetical protein
MHSLRNHDLSRGILRGQPSHGSRARQTPDDGLWRDGARVRQLRSWSSCARESHGSSSGGGGSVEMCVWASDAVLLFPVLKICLMGKPQV